MEKRLEEVEKLCEGQESVVVLAERNAFDLTALAVMVDCIGMLIVFYDASKCMKAQQIKRRSQGCWSR